MIIPGAARAQLTRVLKTAFVGGLISEQTFAARVDEVFSARIIDVDQLIGDLPCRHSRSSVVDRFPDAVTCIMTRLGGFFGKKRPVLLLALVWSAEPCDLVLGRSKSCDIVLSDSTVSRRHARLTLRDGAWVFQDLSSTNGSVLNGRRVRRCEIRPGDRLLLGQVLLRVD
jgi:hypothetical protein